MDEAAPPGAHVLVQVGAVLVADQVRQEGRECGADEQERKKNSPGQQHNTDIECIALLETARQDKSRQDDQG